MCNYDGVALKSTLPKDVTAKYAGLFSQLIVKTRSVVRTIDAEVGALDGRGGVEALSKGWARGGWSGRGTDPTRGSFSNLVYSRTTQNPPPPCARRTT